MAAAAELFVNLPLGGLDMGARQEYLARKAADLRGTQSGPLRLASGQLVLSSASSDPQRCAEQNQLSSPLSRAFHAALQATYPCPSQRRSLIPKSPLRSPVLHSELLVQGIHLPVRFDPSGPSCLELSERLGVPLGKVDVQKLVPQQKAHRARLDVR